MRKIILQLLVFLTFSLSLFAQEECLYTYIPYKSLDYNSPPIVGCSKTNIISLAINYKESSTLILFNNKYKIIDSIVFQEKIKKTSFFNDSIIVLLDINEKNIYKWNFYDKTIDILKCNNAEDWYININNDYKFIFENLLCPISYYITNNSDVQSIYNTRFDHIYSFIHDNKNNVYYVHPLVIEQITINNDFYKQNSKKEGDALFFSNYIYLNMNIIFLDKKNKLLYYKESDGLKKLNLKNQNISIVSNSFLSDFAILNNGKIIKSTINQNKIILSFIGNVSN